MLGTKKCGVCGEKVKSSHNFCSNCGTQVKNSSETWGLLGKNDSDFGKTGLFGGIQEKLLNKMLSSTFKMLEKEFQKGMVKDQVFPGTRVKLMINGKEVVPEGAKPLKKDANVKFLPIDFSEDNLKKWKSIKKKEPKSKLKRVEDKIEYEVEVPGVKSIKDISIVKLENSLEVKAVGDKTGYLKRIPIDLPLKKYSLVKGILTLELDAI